MRASKRRLRSSPKHGRQRNDSRTAAASGLSTTSWSSRRPAKNRTRRSGWPPGPPPSVRRVAERGYNLLLDQFAAFDVIGERISIFKAERAACGRAYNPMGIALARDMHVANNQAAKEDALERNRQFHERILSVARWPDHAGGSHILAYSHSPEEAEANSLIGTPDEIIIKLETLRRCGVEYVIMNYGGSRESLHRFAHEIMPTFSDEPAKVRTATG